jgi:hypothetical protein
VTAGRRRSSIVADVDETTADATCIARVWVERDDPVLRGRVESTLDNESTTARGRDDLVAAIRAELDRIEHALVQQLEGT